MDGFMVIQRDQAQVYLIIQQFTSLGIIIPSIITISLLNVILLFLLNSWDCVRVNL